jgi:uncharacterized protein (TIGR02594 family)
MVAFCRLLLAALALCIAAIAVSVTPASARSHHRSAHHAQAYPGHHARWHQPQYHSRYHYRQVAWQSRSGRDTAAMPAPGYAFVTPDVESATRIVRYKARHSLRRAAQPSRWERGVAPMQTRGLADSYTGVVPNAGGVTFEHSISSGSGLVADARLYLGGNPTGRGSLWCARFMNMVLQHNGYRGTGSDMASSFAHYGTRISGPQVGAIAVMTRGRGGGHVGIVTGVDASGNPIMISGNNGNRVREAPVSRGRIYAYVMPN